MPRPQKAVVTLARYLTLTLMCACLSGMAYAQTPSVPKDVAENVVASEKAPPAETPPALKTEVETVKTNAPATLEAPATPEAPAKSEAAVKTPAPAATCTRTITADVVAIPQPIMLNRIGAAVPDGLIFALRNDVEQGVNSLTLKKYKRARPIVLRANVGDCLQITLTNAIPITPKNHFQNTTIPGASIGTTEVSLHVQGLEWVNGTGDDGTFVGRNNSSLATASPTPAPPAQMPPATQTYKLFAREEGTFLLYTMGDSSVQQGLQIMRGLFGAVNIEPAGAEWYRSQITAEDMKLAQTGITPAGQPILNYDAVYPTGHPREGQPILKMLDGSNKLLRSDLTAIITGPNAGRFPGTTGVNNPEPPCDSEGEHAAGPAFDPLFCRNPASPDRKQPYREVTIIYHEAMNAVTQQAFPVFTEGVMQQTLAGGKDAFAINYGTGGISAEIYANRIGVGPMGPCVDCKFEEFFLSAWPVGDPAMLVDYPANSNDLSTQPPDPNTGLNFKPPCNSTTAFETNKTCGNDRTPLNPPNPQPYTIKPTVKATVAFYPDDPSNVYHSYINDHIKFRILHGGLGVTHVHHQHAHQWLQSPNSDQSSYLDSQMISPGASYTLEMVYNGSGNRNKVVGDSIFHCHFYPHFASGMWAMWRTHDTFEAGTFVYPADDTINGTPVKKGQVVAGARALPDGEIIAGTPTPAIVPMPTLPMAPLPGYAQIQTNVTVNGAPTNFGGQVVLGGTCLNNKIKGTNLQVSGGCTNNAQLQGTVINSAFDPATKMLTGQFQPHALKNPGFPYFIPGIAGARAPHPPLDFATDGGVVLDGGLPRHVISGGSIKDESHDEADWSKDFLALKATQLSEVGTAAELAAMSFFGQRCHDSFLPTGPAAACNPQKKGGFILNGLPDKNPAGNAAEQRGAKPGAPFADPAVDDDGNPVKDPQNPANPAKVRRYKAAAIQLNLVFNKAALGWHYPQARMLALWQDVKPTINFSFNRTPARPPEPLFFRGNSGEIVEYWHTNLVPNYYIVDDFQVRTPTDILGQHIHLVKFDVTASDGAGNGFNYEDGTFSPNEVQEIHDAVNKPGGSWTPCAGAGCQSLRNPTPPPAEICAGADPPPQCTDGRWNGAQTTIQRWYIDPLEDNQGKDRTMRTVFTHDHFGPSTHQQAGLYAGLLIEPTGSTWKSNDGIETFGSRSDGGPTSWEAMILTPNTADSYREFMLEFQDFQLAYQVNTLPSTPAPKFPSAFSVPDPNHKKGYRDLAYAIGAPSTPQIISTGTIGSQSVNYRNEPIPWRAQILTPGMADLSNAFDSDIPGLLTGDPFTPLMRAYQGDKVQVRMLVGAHQYAHQFNFGGPTWLAEPSWKNSGYRSAQPMGLSEHFEFLFNVPFTSRKNTRPPSDGGPEDLLPCPDKLSNGFCVDYLYSPSFDETGIGNGMWGLFRSYDPTKKLTVDPVRGLKGLAELPNNLISVANTVNYQTCPVGAPSRNYKITAVTSQKALAGIGKYQTPEDSTKGQIVFNDRGDNETNFLRNRLGIMYVFTADLENGRLKPGTPVEPLVLRANAGDCINIELTNAIDPTSDLFTQSFDYRQPLTGPMAPAFTSAFASKLVGLYPQLVAYDATNSMGINVGYNRLVTNGRTQIAKFPTAPNPPAKIPFLQKYQWYAGRIERNGNTPDMKYTKVEFGSGNLFPSDPLFQNINGLFGQIIIEPEDSTWNCGESGSVTNCYPPGSPTTRTSATVTAPGGSFREFSTMISDSIRISQNNSSAVNYGTEPATFRFAGTSGNDFSCMLSNLLVSNPGASKPVDQQGEPKTPIFTADIGNQVRFRMTHPFGTGTSQVFTVSGHVWQRNPFTKQGTVIGSNALSQWLGSRDNHGSSDHFELVINKAGGEQGKGGDYLYGVYLRDQITLGAWGLFRVGPRQVGPGPNAACQQVSPISRQPGKEDPDLKQFKRQPAANDPKQ